MAFSVIVPRELDSPVVIDGNQDGVRYHSQGRTVASYNIVVVVVVIFILFVIVIVARFTKI